MAFQLVQLVSVDEALEDVAFADRVQEQRVVQLGVRNRFCSEVVAEDAVKNQIRVRGIEAF
jgi:hypothetical protein